MFWIHRYKDSVWLGMVSGGRQDMNCGLTYGNISTVVSKANLSREILVLSKI